jgi:hypothetical protein
VTDAVIGLPHVLVATVLVAVALIAMYRRKDSMPRLLAGIVFAVVFLVVTWQWVQNFRSCRVIGGAFSYCLTR